MVDEQTPVEGDRDKRLLYKLLPLLLSTENERRQYMSIINPSGKEIFSVTTELCGKPLTLWFPAAWPTWATNT